MAFPKHLKTALASTDASVTFSGTYTFDQECQGAKFHSPQPLLVRPRPLANGETVHLCGTCADNLTILSKLLMESEGNLDWEIRREFGNIIREVGLRGHQAFTESNG